MPFFHHGFKDKKVELVPPTDFSLITPNRFASIIADVQFLKQQIEAGNTRESHLARLKVVRHMGILESGVSMSAGISEDFQPPIRSAIYFLFEGLKGGNQANRLDACAKFLEAVQPSEVAEVFSSDIHIIPGGFRYRGLVTT
jgi:hypothetical protein